MASSPSLMCRYKRLRLVVLAVLILPLSGCGVITRTGIAILYRGADLPSNQIQSNLCYLPDNSCTDESRRLDLYLPSGKDWPVIVFVHGGGWDEGNKLLRVGGADVYSNIGRFYAANGIGVAVINYRLMPRTDWRGQVEDVKAALKWVSGHIESYGGRRDQMFVMGHSAGAHLSSFATLTLKPEDIVSIKGVIAVSGAALDIADQTTYDLGANIRYYEKRFRGNDTTDAWKKAASPIYSITTEAPPYLILYAGGESKSLKRQSYVLNEALQKKQIETRLVAVPGQSHARIVLTLSRPDRTAAPEILRFIDRLRS